MATLGLEGGHRARRSVDADVNLVPMIDLLVVTITFLLITAVWSTMARVPANASLGGRSGDGCEEGCKPVRKLHVDARDPGKFVVSWRDGKEVVASFEVPRLEEAEVRGSSRRVRFPALQAKVVEEWAQHGAHREPTDTRFDSAVIHASDSMPYASLVGVMDATLAAKRELGKGDARTRASAFDVTFAMD